MALNIEPGTCFQNYPSCQAMRYTSPCGPKLIPYTIQPGDNLWNLASQYNTTIEEIMAINPGINPYNLQVGQAILIPDPPFGWGFGFGPFWGYRPWFGYGFGGPWFGGGFFGPWI